ncbi:hypothetical protein MPPM_5543 (plasmid) [Methylorubrum populi]|uniref:Uncharacterized protein n=1 Tax=Methylorubrum populi TaxID=223967 RepID=A0A169RKL0_9HYPH|nr:hypothetical protein [Methylorubrum populi]BAU94148.1 hypothetical protein MPPM_5543 [Methylorubrum populi]
MARSPSRTPPSTVEVRLRAAQEAERAATQRVQQASRARLAELLRMPPRERLGHLDDPAVVAPDRVSLRRSLQADLTRPRRRWRPGGRLQALGRRFGAAALHQFLHPAVLGLAGITGVWLYTAWSATPHLAISTQALSSNLIGPDGRVESYTFPARTWVPVERLDAQVAQTRVWYSGQGYGHGTVWRSGLYLSR